MAIGEHKTEWAGQRVVEWKAGDPISDPTGVAYRLTHVYEYRKQDIPLSEVFAQFLETHGSSEVTGLVIGNWLENAAFGDSSQAVEMLAGASARFPRLRSLFFGDITYEECEISWLRQSDMAPLLSAFPHLEHFGVRGANGLSLGHHFLPNLKTLVIESGGMPAELVEEAIMLDAPNLEHLELWLGEDGYGATSTVETLRPIFDGVAKWPKLTYLGLCDSELADEIAEQIVTAPILTQLHVLDLSLGVLSDQGARFLVESEAIRGLKLLDLHRHYLSPEMEERFRSLDIEVDVDGSEWEEAMSEADEDGTLLRYVAVGE